MVDIGIWLNFIRRRVKKDRGGSRKLRATPLVFSQ